ncbi:hypothetical protein GOBAR_AA31874 [Gossypium barbadense]|uniref:Uncharacterized protein n=1 Tax=Gossypium barbadense TaxID=3634 RepID=A0A2P5WCJ3_GOSBA|nr:hypothetical protein GOBAR_AA31874 [Gossypium barbadense]
MCWKYVFDREVAFFILKGPRFSSHVLAANHNQLTLSNNHLSIQHTIFYSLSFICNINSTGKGRKGSGGGALSSTCNEAAESSKAIASSRMRLELERGLSLHFVGWSEKVGDGDGSAGLIPPMSDDKVVSRPKGDEGHQIKSSNSRMLCQYLK